MHRAYPYGVTRADHRGKIMGLMDVLREHRQVGLPPLEYTHDLLESFNRHDTHYTHSLQVSVAFGVKVQRG